MAKTLNSALSSIYDRFVFTGSTRSEFYYTGGIGGDDTQVTALQLTTLKNVDDEVVLITDSSQDVTLSNDLKLLSDASILNFGAHNDVKLTHVADTGLLLTQDGSGSIPVLQIREAGLAISSSASGQLDIDAGTTLEMTAPTIELVGAILNLGENDASDVTINLLGTNNDMAIVYDESAKKLAFDTDVLVVDGSANRVGIGVTDPDAPLEVAYTTAATASKSYGIKITGNDSGTSGESAMLFLSAMSSSTRGCYIAAEVQSASNDHDLIFATSANGAVPTEAMRIDEDGQVGIGTTSPDYLLDVESAGDSIKARIWNGTHGFVFYPYDAQAMLGTITDQKMQFGIGGNAKMTIDGNGGKVGIGTTGPDTTLHLADDTSGNSGYPVLRLEMNDTTLSIDDFVGKIEWEHQDDAGAGVAANIVVVAEDNSGNVAMTFGNARNAATERMRIDSSGNVGIGMTPNTAFNVKGAANSGIRLYKSDGTSQTANIEGDANEHGQLTAYNSSEVAQIYFTASGGNSYIKTGNLGIGTSYPEKKLTVQEDNNPAEMNFNRNDDTIVADDVLGAIYGTGDDPISGSFYPGAAIKFVADGTWGDDDTSDSPGRIEFFTTPNDSVTPVTRMRITKDGELVVNDLDDASGNHAVEFNTTSKEVTYDSSDERYKENIVNCTYGLAEVLQLNPIKYDKIPGKVNLDCSTWTRNESKPTAKNKYGFSAQAVEAVMPDLQCGVDILKSYSTKGLQAVLVKAIQELSAKVTALENA